MKKNRLDILFDRLREEGWYCGWGHACCQSCAWMDIPDYFDAQYDKDGYLIREDKDGNPIEYKDVDLAKVLFNHEPEEAKGWLMGLVINMENDTTELQFFDALAIERGPTGIIHLPHRVPPGFHGNWIPD